LRILAPGTEGLHRHVHAFLAEFLHRISAHGFSGAWCFGDAVPRSSQRGR
jgi:hypothetical protein